MTSLSGRPEGRARIYFTVNCGPQHRWPKVPTVTQGESKLSLLEEKLALFTMRMKPRLWDHTVLGGNSVQLRCVLDPGMGTDSNLSTKALALSR